MKKMYVLWFAFLLVVITILGVFGSTYNYPSVSSSSSTSSSSSSGGGGSSSSGGGRVSGNHSNEGEINFDTEKLIAYICGDIINIEKRTCWNNEECLDIELGCNYCYPFNMDIEFDSDYNNPFGSWFCHHSEESASLYLTFKNNLSLYTEKSTGLSWVFFKDRHGKYYQWPSLIETSSIEKKGYGPNPNNPILNIVLSGFMVGEDGDKIETSTFLSFGIENENNLTDVHGEFIGYVHKDQDFEQRISALESWKNAITKIIQNIWDAITGLVATTDNHKKRIEILEDSDSSDSNSSNSEFKSYLKYLGDSDRKKILCGYAQEKHLTNIQDLGLNCDLFYKTLSNRKEKVSCRCKNI